MTKLMAAMRSDPDATFEVTADLPSGNCMEGTVGPILNGRMCASITFREPPSDVDIELAQTVMNEALGTPAHEVIESRSHAEHQAAISRVQRFFGGGRG